MISGARISGIRALAVALRAHRPAFRHRIPEERAPQARGVLRQVTGGPGYWVCLVVGTDAGNTKPSSDGICMGTGCNGPTVTPPARGAGSCAPRTGQP